MTIGRQRLDEALVARGLAPSRARARDLILRGLVRVGESTAAKPAQLVTPQAVVTLAADAPRYVSRGAEKLVAALEAFGFDAAGRVALDVGASTGGFSEILLQRGVTRVYAVDVGHGQLHAQIASDPRVVALEGTDSRRLDLTLVPEPIGAIVADVSFISVTLALPATLALATPGAWLVVLVKPQFEAGREAVGKGGIVRDPTAREAAVSRVRDWIGAQPGWTVIGLIPSPIAGGSGNLEYLIGAVRDE